MRATGTENEPPREQLASAVDSVERLAQQYEARKRRKHERNQATTLKRKTTLELPLRAQFGLPERGSDKHVAKAWLAAFILADTEVIKRVFPAAIIMPLPDRNEAHYRQILQILFDMSRAAIVENPRRGKKTAEGRKSKGGRDLLRTHEAKAAEWIGGITGVREKDKSVTIEVMESVLPFFERLYESNNIGLFQSCGLDAAPTDPTLFKAWAQEVLLYYGVRGCSRGLDYLVKHREKFLATYGG